MSFLASSSRGFSSFRSAEIFGARELIARIVDDFIGMQLGCGVRAKAVDLARESDQGKQQEHLQEQGCRETAVSD
jgi:hypothetical protein